MIGPDRANASERSRGEIQHGGQRRGSGSVGKKTMITVARSVTGGMVAVPGVRPGRSADGDGRGPRRFPWKVARRHQPRVGIDGHGDGGSTVATAVGSGRNRPEKMENGGSAESGDDSFGNQSRRRGYRLTRRRAVNYSAKSATVIGVQVSRNFFWKETSNPGSIGANSFRSVVFMTAHSVTRIGLSGARWAAQLWWSAVKKHGSQRLYRQRRWSVMVAIDFRMRVSIVGDTAAGGAHRAPEFGSEKLDGGDRKYVENPEKLRRK